MSATDGEVGARTRAALRANVYGTEYVLGELSAKVEGLERSIARLEAENAKLRELCGLMFARLYTLVDDRWYPLYEGDEMKPYDVFDRYDELVQMGIEVD